VWPLGIAIVIAALLGAVAVVPANAASGGGCGAANNHAWGHHTACISAIRWGTAKPDGYVTMYAGHPSCEIVVMAYSESGQALPESRNSYFCTSGAFSRRVEGLHFERTSGRYRTVVSVIYGGATRNAHSPYLTLP
jgi:hypothetical protein